jgi:phage recombination protein Bet
MESKMSALVKHESTSVASLHGRTFNKDQVDLIKRTICKGANDDELQLFMYQAERTGLDPLARQIYAVKRKQFDSDANRWIEIMSIQTSIDGFRLIAERSGKYAGQVGPFWCGDDGQWQDVWVAKTPPTAARVGALRSDFHEPCWGVARLDAYAQKKKDGSLTRMWTNMADVMIAKCAEALALRKAFPQELSGLYTNDEMEQASSPAVPQIAENKIEPQTVNVPTHNPQTGEVGPHQIPVPILADGSGSDWIGFGSLVLAAIKSSSNKAESDIWTSRNSTALAEMNKSAPKVFMRLMSAIKKRDEEFGKIAISSAAEDPEAWFIWLGQQCNAMMDVPALDAFMQIIEPQMKEAMPPDRKAATDLLAARREALEKKA